MAFLGRTRPILDLLKLRATIATNTSGITSFTSNSLFSAGAFFINPRILVITALARSPSATISSTTCRRTSGSRFRSAWQSQASVSVIGYSRERLVDFMRYRSRQFAHCCQPGNPGKLPLCYVKGLLCHNMFFLCSLLRGQTQNEGHTVVPTAFEECSAQEYRHTAAVFSETFLFIGQERPGRLELRDCPVVALPPFGWGEVGPTHATGCKIVVIVLHHVQKRFIRFGDQPIEIPHHDAHNVGVDQTPNLDSNPLASLRTSASAFSRSATSIWRSSMRMSA